MMTKLILVVLLFAMVDGVSAHAAQSQTDLILYSLSYSPDGNYVAGVGKRVAIWDGETGDLITSFELDLDSSDTLLLDAAWSPDANRLAVAGTDRRIRILDFSDDAQTLGMILTEFELMTFLDVRSIGWSPDDSLIAIGGDGVSPHIEFWDASTYQFRWSSTYVMGAYRMAWHPDPQRNLIAVADGYLNGASQANTAEDAPRNNMILCGDCAPDAIALPLAWNSDGSLLAIGNTNGSIFIMDADTNRVVADMQGGEFVSELVWSNDNHYLLSLSRAGLQIWDSVTANLLNNPPFLLGSEIAVHPFNNKIFYFDPVTDAGVLLDISTLLDSTVKIAEINPG